MKDVLALQNLEGLHCLRLAVASLFEISSIQRDGSRNNVVRCLTKTIEYNADASHAYLDSSDPIPLILTGKGAGIWCQLN